MPPPDLTYLNLFAVCLPGLESLLEQELRAQNALEPVVVPGGVTFRGDLETVYRANLECGVASQVLIRVAEFGARSLADLDRRGARVDWSHWLRPGTPVTIKSNCRRSRIYHSGAASERVARHIHEHGGTTDEPLEETPVVCRVRIHDNRCQISLDSSGDPLHRRGWRLDPGPAPLREDLARALVMVSGWDQKSTLLDPMMGSGTILIEAAGLARRLAPGRLRSFAIESLAVHDDRILAAVRERASEIARDGLEYRLFGSDRSATAVATAAANAGRAGVHGDLELRQAPLGTATKGLVLGEVGAVVTNPPYGKRLDDSSKLTALYRAFGDLGRTLPRDWRIAIAAADRRLALRTGLDLETEFLADSGGLKIRAMLASATRSRPLSPDARRAPPSSAP